MDDQLTQLLNELAIKLGVTTEYLWTALLRQAFISSLTITLAIGAWIAILYYWNKRIKKLKPNPPMDDDTVIVIQWVLWYAASGAVAIVTAGCIEAIVAGFFNPEYWALMQVLK